MVPSEVPVALVLGETGNSSWPRGMQHPYLQYESTSEPRQGRVLRAVKFPNWEESGCAVVAPVGQGPWGHTPPPSLPSC